MQFPRCRLKPLLAVLLLLSAAPANAWRCGTALVQEGDTRKDVLQECGRPSAHFSQEVTYKLEIGTVHERRRFQTIDYWVYLTGPNRFARILYFEDGILKSIRRGDYGRDYTADRSNCQRENNNIDTNQSKPELTMRCGEPDRRRKLEEYTAAVVIDNGNRVFRDVVVDEWIYFDGDRLRTYRFENGLLKRQHEEDR